MNFDQNSIDQLIILLLLLNAPYLCRGTARAYAHVCAYGIVDDGDASKITNRPYGGQIIL